MICILRVIDPVLLQHRLSEEVLSVAFIQIVQIVDPRIEDAPNRHLKEKAPTRILLVSA